MKFLFPQFLWALLLLIIPIIIHLFNFRRYKKVVFSNVTMLKEIETQSRKTKQLRKWLILLTRIIALSSLILAFAIPYIHSKDSLFGRKLISIYIDNSQSMLAEGENGQLFEVAKNKAREIIRTLPKNSEIQVIDNGLSFSSNKTNSSSNALRLIDNMDIDHRPNDLSGVLKKIESMFKSDSYGHNYTFLISDFQSQERTDNIALDSNYHIYGCPVYPNLSQNLAIDSVWLIKPITQSFKPIEMMARIHNYGRKGNFLSNLTLKINGVQRVVKSIDIPENSYRDVPLSFIYSGTGWLGGELTVSDVPIDFDNSYYFSILIDSSIKVLQLGEDSDEFSRIFDSDSLFYFSHSDLNQIDYSGLNFYDCIILNQLPKMSSGLISQLKNFVEDGGVLSVVPGVSNISYTDFFSELGISNYQIKVDDEMGVSPLSISGVFLKDAYKQIPSNLLLPKIKTYYRLKSNPQSDKIIYLKDGTEILTKTDIGSGSVFQSTVPFDSNFNYTSSELFVIIQLKIAFSKRKTQSIASEINSTNPVYLPKSSGLIHLRKGNSDIVTESYTHSLGSRFWLNDAISESGIYSVFDSEELPIAKLAFNYSRKESHQNYLDEVRIDEVFDNTQFTMNKNNMVSLLKSTQDLQNRSQLWKVFILVCLIFLMIEILLLRFVKS
ncbi:MAG: BatA and WFA domain-containing protein [Bacteroidia bacterium]|nr:BatA and WFA domain-containing protein [Bacteroidia bacterium]